jgi:dephospho-CoA kinase|tara:strand:+ start:12988 stop:13578 length:591 start_codon:yes stop_codon:yes gene_type:complete
MIKIGLTGSIGMGKTETGKIFSEFGFPLYNADNAVHRLYTPGQKGAEKIKETFPAAINPDGSVNRENLSKEVLGDTEKIKILEGIIHPLVGEDREIFFLENTNAHAVVLDIPLLFETGGEKYVDIVVVVDAPKDIQEKRVLSRPNMTKEKFKKIIAEQMPNELKKEKADFVVDTSVGIEDAIRQVGEIVKKIKDSK